MRKRWWTLLIALAAVILLWRISPRQPEPAVARILPNRPARPAEVFPARPTRLKATHPPAAQPSNPASSPVETIPAGPEHSSRMASAEPVSAPEAGSELSPATELENMRRVFRDYSSRFGGNPVGTNPEITRALNGGNPGQVNFLKPDDGMRINEHGELVDNWGTPYFFHQLSRTEMEIHSAGPDRRMWTLDDLVTK